MNEISLFSANTVTHTHASLLTHLYICIYTTLHIHTYNCIYLEQERKSTICRANRRVANWVDKLFTF